MLARNGSLLVRICYLNLCVYAARPPALMALTISYDEMNPVDAQYVLPLDPKSHLRIIRIEMEQMKKEKKSRTHTHTHTLNHSNRITHLKSKKRERNDTIF